MQRVLRQGSTPTLVTPQFLSLSDGTPATGLSIAQSDIQINKFNTSTFAQSGNASGATHQANGHYSFALAAGDTDTVGALTISITKSGAAAWSERWEVIPAAIYDAYVAGSADINVNVSKISGDSTAADNAEAAFDGTGFNVGAGSIVVNSVTGDVGGNVSGSVAGSVGSLAAQAQADVNAQADNAIADASLVSQSYLDTAVSALATASALSTFATDTGTALANIAAKTDNLPAEPAAVGSAMTLSASLDLYYPSLDLVADETNSQDELTFTFTKNANQISSGITSPTVTIINRADNSTHLASTSLTQIGSTGLYKLDLSGSDRLTKGESYIFVVSATIDGSARTRRIVKGFDAVA